MKTGEVIFQQYQRQNQYLNRLVNLLGDIIEKVEADEDATAQAHEAKTYLLIETRLGERFLTDENES